MQTLALETEGEFTHLTGRQCIVEYVHILIHHASETMCEMGLPHRSLEVQELNLHDSPLFDWKSQMFTGL